MPSRCAAQVSRASNAGHKACPPLREAVFDLRRHLVVDHATHDSVPFHLPKLLDEHFLGYSRDRAFKIGEAQNMPAKEVKQDHELPASLKKLERVLDALGCFSRVWV